MIKGVERRNGKYYTNGKEFKDLNELELEMLNDYFVQYNIFLNQKTINNILVFDALEVIEN